MRVLLFVFVLSIQSVCWGALDSSDLLRGCRLIVTADHDEGVYASFTHGDTLHYAHASGYINAIVETSIYYESLHPIYHTKYPENMDTAAYARVLVKYMDDHPELLHLKPWLIVQGAFKDAWPGKGAVFVD